MNYVWVSLALAGLCVSASAGEVVSGPQKGEPVRPYNPEWFVGVDKGSTACPV